jgi:cell division protein ZapA
LRNAGKVINDKLRQFRAQFGIDDKQDLLAMVAIDCMVEKLQSDEEKTGVSTVIADKLNHLDDLLSSAL